MKKIYFTLIGFLVQWYSVDAQTIDINGVRYGFSGAYAYVSKYLGGEGTCVIPEKIVDDGLEYIVKRIESRAFQSSSVSEIYLPETIEEIGASAFMSCTNLRKIYLPYSLKKIESFAFLNCQSLTQLIIPPNVNFVDDGHTSASLFNGCNKLRTLIYTGIQPPSYWTATTYTYVPSLETYSSPQWVINQQGNIIPLMEFHPTDFTYTGSKPAMGWYNNIEDYSIEPNTEDININAGSYTQYIPVTFTKDNDSFTTKIVFHYVIRPAQLVVKTNSVSREYGEDNPDFILSYEGFVNGEDESVITSVPTVSTTATKTSNVGDYSITISGGSAKNYELVYEPGNLIITKAQLTAIVDDTTRTYGTQNPDFTMKFQGLKNGDTAPIWITKPEYQTVATQESSVGQYEVTAVNGELVNYELSEVIPGELSVTPAPLTIKANDATRQYYGDEPEFSYVCDGFVNGDDENMLSEKPTLTTSAARSSDVGTYEVKASGAASNNYTISYMNGTLSVTPRTLTASVGNYERLYNEDNPDFEVSYNGFVGNDDASVLSVAPTAKTSATKKSDVGTYTIEVTGGNADNYKFNYNSGVLTINKTEQTIVWEQDLSELNVGDQVELKAEASSGLPITYTFDATEAAELYSAGNKSYLDCLTGGQFMIRAVQEGNKNYYSSPRASNMVKIVGTNPATDPTLTIEQADNGYVSTYVPKGSVYTFTIAAGNGWKIHSVSFNDSDVTGDLDSKNSFTTPVINSNSTLSVVYEEDVPTALSSMQRSAVKIQATSFGARVNGAANDDLIQVFTTDGVLQKSVRAEVQTTDIPLAKDNIYIIKVGEKTVKLGH